jgi:1-deoxy-D-xylulose-5-phosphate reductoisomerase
VTSDRAGLSTRPLVILGATGSIGGQALEVAARLQIPVAAVAARQGSERLAAIAVQHPDCLIGVSAPTAAEQQRFSAQFGSRMRFGPEVLAELAALPDCVVINGVVGFAGLPATLSALEAGNRLGLANKESLVAAGPLVQEALRRTDAELIPVDSEHSALFQCLVGESPDQVRSLVLTASGGPFLGRTPEQLDSVTPAEALAHPTWSMGPRITVDSATLVNKGLEVIEAHFLFEIPFQRIEVVVHPQSIVHSLVEFIDGSLKAHMGEPDMRVPIQYAITYPSRSPGVLEPFALAGRDLVFRAPDRDSFPALDLAYEAGRRGGTAPAVFNAADEVAVRAFLEGRLGFRGIPLVLEKTLSATGWTDVTAMADVLEADREARAVAHGLIGGLC